ncbi:PD-(D/E)XK nuclease family protein [Aequorivita sediminis]|uniref:PDDEXK-like family protein n=1 Tax=Aequorivita sediminis TaxID=3073653 RepID=UPI0028AFEA2E|nr:PD-(D/E)XK nuclease family protein [Aequorivita sp. F6058]
MEIPITAYKILLSDTARIIKHQEEIAILKGETFNVFSILNMEYRENETHSAFLGELLNPKGSHCMGPVFLKCFLKQLDVEEHINLDTAKVVLEKSLGARNDKTVLGGRVDIYIEDKEGKSVCIENKIHAADQDVQIARYCNHNAEYNKVYYLNLEGDSPSKKSYRKKIVDQDFFIISYKVDVLEWLEQCEKEATQFPILRETIKQYSILIKKLTNQLSDHSMEQEVKNTIIANYKAAGVIASTIPTIELEYTEKFISEVVEKLRKILSEDFSVTMSEDLNKAWSGITIRNKNWPKDVIIKLEGASKIPWGNSIYGVHCHKRNFDRLKIKNSLKEVQLVQSGYNETEYWPYYKVVLRLRTPDQRSRLFNEFERAALINEITDKLSELATLCEIPFSNLDVN